MLRIAIRLLVRMPLFAAGLALLSLLAQATRAATPVKKTWEEIVAERQNWWSFQPVRVVEPPSVSDAAWSASVVDRFLRDRMLRENIEPAPRADAETLIRRAALVLTGLPPAPEEVPAFVKASQANAAAAYAALLERLLASPHFGERFARHWLDVVRFTETHGNEWNYDAAYAWRYRDYVIRAFNEDVPYDQFAREHIAGDLLAAPRWNTAGHFNESAIGTAFYRFGEVNHDSCVQFGVIGYDIVDNQLDTLTKTFQATTVACARCHDHKLDAVSTKDYHAMLAVLRSSRSVMHTLDSPEVNRDSISMLRALKQDMRRELATLWRENARTLDAARLNQVAVPPKGQAPDVGSPLHAWFIACRPEAKNIEKAWSDLAAAHTKELAENTEFNRTHFSTLADFRHGIPNGWFTDGMGLRDAPGAAGDFVVAPEGSAALQEILPSGVVTFALSARLNGALRSPTLERSHAKVSFEVEGGRFSLARLVFNNCQLNYTSQHSLHNNDWSWITIDFPDHSDELHPYAELLTFWDNPKFPDPLGALGKDTANLRGPYAEYAKNPRTWWGVRRVVLHDGGETPRPERGFLSRLFAGAPPKTAEEAARRYSAIASEAVEAFAAQHATDEDVSWLSGLMKSGLLSNQTNASPRLAELTAQYRAVEDQLARPTTMPGMADEGDGFAQPLLARGDSTQPGESVARGFVQALTPAGFQMSPHGSGRRELAQLIASPDNPLTARVMVNRVWQWVFGRGIVASPDDFGHLGAIPAHPELLDDLTARFIAEGWSVKKLIRTLMLSRAFQSASAPTESATQRDPQNVLLSHSTARRAEAEVIRDSILAVSGRLDAQLYGPSVHPFREKADPEKRLFVGPLDGDGRRSLYVKFQLMEAPRFLSAFNLPGGKVTQGRREVSNTPAQSLALLNDPFVLAMAGQWAEKLMTDGRQTLASRAEAMFRAALGRSPRAAERERLVSTLRSLAASRGVPEDGILTSAPVWQDAAHLMFNLKEFIFIP